MRIAIAFLALAVAACATRNPAAGKGAKSTAAAPPSAPASGNGGEDSLGATVQIDYARSDDFLSAVTVFKFTGAQMIPLKLGEEKQGTSIIRFEGGGVPIWQIHANQGIAGTLLTEVPMLGAGNKYALKTVKYGRVPKGFFQTTPESGPPEPLEAGSYYVFEVERASGSTSYQAMRIDRGGTIESYDAQPRVGESYAVCCNLSDDFLSGEPPAAADNPPATDSGSEPLP